MCLAGLALQTVLLIAEGVFSLLLLSHGEYPRPERRAAAHGEMVFAVLLDLLRIELIKRLNCELEVGNERVTSRLGEVLAHNNA